MMKKILAIDDQQDNLTTIIAVIKSQMADCIVLTALSGREGLLIAKEEQPDTILLDIIMPQMDGYETCKRLKADALTKHIPVVMITAIKSDIVSRVKALDLGADAFLSKPIDAIELMAQVNVMLRIKESEDKLRAEKTDIEQIVQNRTTELLHANKKLNQEIEERRRKEDALLESENRYWELVESSTDAIAICIDEKIVFVNKASLSLMRAKSVDELMGMNVIEFVHPDFREFAGKRMNEAMLAQKTLPSTEEKFVRLDGSEIDVEVKSFPIIYKRKMAIQLIIRDITESKQARIDLQHSYDQYRMLINLAPDAFFQGDSKGNFIEANLTAIELTGYAYEELMTMNMSDLFSESQLEQQPLNYDLLKRGDKVTAIRELIKKDGSIIIVEMNSKKMRDGTYQAFLRDITERRRAELALMESEERYKNFVTQVSEGVYRFELDVPMSIDLPVEEQIDFMYDHMIIAECNQAFMQMYGIGELKDVIGKSQKQLHGGSNNPENRNAILKFIASGYRSQNNETIETVANGNSRYFSNNSVGIIENGYLVRSWGTQSDITQRKIIENELTKLSKAVEQSPVSILITDTNGNIEYANPKVSETSGYSLDELIGKNPRIFNSREKTKSEYQSLWATISSGKEWFGEFHNKKKNGELYWEHASISAILNEKGRISHFLAVKEDITKRKLAELALKDSEALYRNLVEVMPDAVYKSTQEGKFVEVNPALVNILGYESKEELLSIDINTQLYFDIDDRESAVLQEKLEEMGVFRLKKKDGSEIWVEDHGWLNYDKEKDILFHEGIMRDITDRKQAELILKEKNEHIAAQNKKLINTNAELIEAKEKAEESDRLKSAFLANMSHEIRTPMNGILGFADLLKQPDLNGEEQQSYIAVIEKAGHRMLNIINNIVDISKIESGQMKASLSKTNVNEQIEFIYSFFESEVEQKGMKLSYKNPLPSSDANIKTDSEKLYAILTNLVKNAIKYTKEGSIDFGYEIVALTPPESGSASYLKFYVRDTGIGITHERQDAIFERFIQADISDVMARQGAGLGLAISKAYVEMLGGKIWVESASGQGSVFYFTIPYLLVENSLDETKNSPLNGIAPPNFKKINIAIAEDDSTSDIYLSTLLKDIGIQIFHAKNGAEVIEICKTSPALDLVLMDIKMPGINGYEATRKIREFNEEVIIIAQTAYALPGDREKALDAGCNDYIQKPIKKSQLMELMQQYFKK